MQFKPYDIKQAKDGDLVMSRIPGLITEVGEVFVGSDEVVVRWAGGYFRLFAKNEDHNLVHKPVFMLNGEPVYLGDTIYNSLGGAPVIEEDMNPLQRPKDLDLDFWSFKPRPKTLNINGHEVPWPETRELGYSQKYWLVGLNQVFEQTWGGASLGPAWLKAGRIHLSRENAEKHRAALLSFFEQD